MSDQNYQINKNLCIGCGTCVGLCPNLFKFGDDNKAELIELNDVRDEQYQKTKKLCPVRAINLIMIVN